MILVILSIVFDFYTYENKKYNTRLADQIFMASLSQARDGFARNYNKMNEDDKNNYYIQTSSSLYAAMNIIDLTSYNNDIKTRNELFEVIYNLYWCMTRNASREALITNSNMFIIYNCLSEIIRNPKDEKDCQTVSKLAGDLYFKNNK